MVMIYANYNYKYNRRFWSADSSAVPVPTRLPLWAEGTYK